MSELRTKALCYLPENWRNFERKTVFWLTGVSLHWFEDFGRVTFSLTFLVYEIGSLGAGQMAQWLWMFVAVAEDLGSVPNAHMVAHNHPLLQFQGI